NPRYTKRHPNRSWTPCAGSTPSSRSWLGRGLPRRAHRGPRGARPPDPARRGPDDPAVVLHRHRRQQGSSPNPPPLRPAGRDIPAHQTELVRHDGQAAHPGPVGIGHKTARKLAELGLHTVIQLACADPAELAERLGPTMGPWYVSLGRGAGSTTVS